MAWGVVRDPEECEVRAVGKRAEVRWWLNSGFYLGPQGMLQELVPARGHQQFPSARQIPQPFAPASSCREEFSTLFVA